jgi:hypothetical protein
MVGAESIPVLLCSEARQLKSLVILRDESSVMMHRSDAFWEVLSNSDLR